MSNATPSDRYNQTLGFERAPAGLTSQQKLLVNVLLFALLTWYAALAVASYMAFDYAFSCPKTIDCLPTPAPLDSFLQDTINGLGTAFTAALGILLGINVAWANARRQDAVMPEHNQQYLKAAWIGAGLFVLSLVLMVFVRLAFSWLDLAPYWPSTLDNLMQTILLITIAAVGGVATLAVTRENASSTPRE